MSFSPSGKHGPTGRVLVAEDDKSVRDSLVRALTFEGYDVVTRRRRRRGARWRCSSRSPT